MSKKKFSFSIPAAVCSLLLSSGTATVFRACAMKEDGTWMHCHDAQRAVTLCAAVLFVLFVLAAWLKSPGAKAVLCSIGIAGSIVTMLLPGNIMPMCMMQTMRCYAVMQPFVRLMSFLVAVCGATALVQALKARHTSN